MVLLVGWLLCGSSYCTHTLHTLALGQIDYYFTDIDQMKRDIEAGCFIEHAVVHKNLYGFC